jgi:mono/diheme cytochrome c family protein
MLLALCLAAVSTAGCRQNMHNQNKVEPYEPSAFYTDGQASRQVPDGTVPRGAYGHKIAPYTGLAVEAPPPAGPPQVTMALLKRGQERYNVFCSPCHDRVGNGRGMIVLRGYKQPPSFHEPRLLSMPPEYFVQVMTEGFGVMPAYAEEVSLQDRWAIAAYMRALQYSQNARLGDIPAERRQALDAQIREGSTTDPRSGAQGVTRPDAVQDYDRRPDPTEVP